MDNRKIFIIVIIGLALNFVIGATALVLAAIPLVSQSTVAGSRISAIQRATDNKMNQGQSDRYQDRTKQGTYGAGQQSIAPQDDNQRNDGQQNDWQEATGPQSNRPQAGSQQGGQQFATPQRGGAPAFGQQRTLPQADRQQAVQKQFAMAQLGGPRAGVQQRAFPKACGQQSGNARFGRQEFSSHICDGRGFNGHRSPGHRHGSSGFGGHRFYGPLMMPMK